MRKNINELEEKKLNFLIFYMHMDNVKILPLYEYLPAFYKDLIKVWTHINKNKTTNNHDNFETIRKQVIWDSYI